MAAQCRQVEKGKLISNDSQRNAAYVLQLLQNSLVPGPAAHGSSPLPVVRGAYLHGNVGSGKTLLLDMFVSTTRAASPALSSTPSTRSQSDDIQRLKYEQQQQQQGQQEHSVQASASSAHPHPHSGHSNHHRAPTPNTSYKSGLTPAIWRVHFHQFMMHVHKRLHALEAEKPKILTRSWNGRPVYRTATTNTNMDPFQALAAEIAASTRVLAVDELHVTDQPDAMLLTRLFTALPPHVVLLFTSNQHPSSLYKKGPSRKYFQPFVDMLISSLVILKLESNVDFRRLGSRKQQEATQPGAAADACSLKLQQVRGAAARGARPFADAISNGGSGVDGLVCTGSTSGQQLQELWEACCAQAAWTGPEEVHVGFGRSIWVPRIASAGEGAKKGDSAAMGSPDSLLSKGSSSSNQETLAYFKFEELLGHTGLRSGASGSGLRGGLSATDYMALCRKYDVLFVEGIPTFSLMLHDEARRCVAFIDTAYEFKCRLALSLASAVELDELFQPLLRAAYLQGMDPNQGTSGQGSTVKVSMQAGLEDLGGGPLVKQEEVLMYHRAVSRLYEMCQ